MINFGLDHRPAPTAEFRPDGRRRTASGDRQKGRRHGVFLANLAGALDPHDCGAWPWICGFETGARRRSVAPAEFREGRPADPLGQLLRLPRARRSKHAKPSCGSIPRKGRSPSSRSGEPVIVPGKPDESDLIDRVESDDPELQMPPKKSGKQLTAEQVAVLRRWVEQGATWSAHWAFEPPRKPALPAVKNAGLADHRGRPVHPGPARGRGALARGRGRQDDLDPPRHPRPDRPAADPRGSRRLPGRSVRMEPMRRSSTGCSTPPATASTWRGSGSTPPATAIRTACTWTITAKSGPIATGSSARSTTTSRSTASSSSNWPATCCPIQRPTRSSPPAINRCHVSTNEGGSIEEEVYVRNIVDQVDTNGTVFLGLTTGCARCHDHKYDPIRMKDYYQLFAFFNNIDGPAMDGNSAKWAPIVPVPTAAPGRGAPGRRRPDRQLATGDRGRGGQGGIRL